MDTSFTLELLNPFTSLLFLISMQLMSPCWKKTFFLRISLNKLIQFNFPILFQNWYWCACSEFSGCCWFGAEKWETLWLWIHYIGAEWNVWMCIMWNSSEWSSISAKLIQWAHKCCQIENLPLSAWNYQKRHEHWLQTRRKMQMFLYVFVSNFVTGEFSEFLWI